MKPPQFATEYQERALQFDKKKWASMKPPQFATEYDAVLEEVLTDSKSFNEAAAICDGIQSIPIVKNCGHFLLQ